MKKKFQNIKKKYPWINYLGNRYFLVLLFFGTWMIFLDNYSYVEHRVLNKQIQELENNKKYYKEEIKKDLEHIRLLRDPDHIEKYAREKYFMKRENEEIYIIEFEDSIPKEHSKPL